MQCIIIMYFKVDVERNKIFKLIKLHSEIDECLICSVITNEINMIKIKSKSF